MCDTVINHMTKDIFKSVILLSLKHEPIQYCPSVLQKFKVTA